MKKRILIVDDDVQILDMLKMTISVWCPDCQIVLAMNGLEALRLVEAVDDAIQPFDTILTDYDMPVMNGPDLAHIVRQNWPDTRIILMSGNHFNKASLFEEVDQEDFDGFIQKPFLIKQVKEFFASDSGIMH